MKKYRITGNSNYHKFSIGEIVYGRPNINFAKVLVILTEGGNYRGEVLKSDCEEITEPQPQPRMRLCTVDDFPVDVEMLRTGDGKKILFAKIRKNSDNVNKGLFYVDAAFGSMTVHCDGKYFMDVKSVYDLMLITLEPVIKKEYQNQYRRNSGAWYKSTTRASEAKSFDTRIGMIERTFENDILVEARLMRPEEYENI